MRYQHESLTQVKDEVKPLLDDHWEEIALNKDTIKLNPDWKKYALLDANNMLRVFTARADGKLVGYFVVIVETALHYSDHVFAHNDIIFLAKEYRRGMTGVKLIKYAEKCLAEEGVKQLFINTKRHQPFDPILERLKFNEVEKVYAKVLR